MAALNTDDIAPLSLYKLPLHLDVQNHQTQHRIALVSKWDIPVGAKVLEIGCGQGDCTVVLAAAVGPTGHVTAVDPAPLTYGSPFTLGEAQSHISSGRLGPLISWKQADPLELLKGNSEPYDVAVLSHCLWYFSSPSAISDTLKLLSSRVKRVCIAEWSLSSPRAQTHILAVLAQAALECRKPTSESNVRTVVSPRRIKEIAIAAGLRLEKEWTITPSDRVLDGQWETKHVLSEDFEKEIEAVTMEQREKEVVWAIRDAVEASLAHVERGAKGVKPMDVWTAVFSGT